MTYPDQPPQHQPQSLQPPTQPQYAPSQPMQVYAPAYLVPAGPRNSGTAITAMILGILSFFPVFVSWIPVIGWFTPLLPLAAVIFGHVALGQIRREGLGGKGMAVTGLVLGYIFLVLTVLFLVFAVVLGAFFLAAAGSAGSLS